MRQECNFVFEAIDQKLEDLKQTSETGETSKDTTVEDEAEDLMETDDEEHETDSETEEDRAFIDDDVDEQGVAFYRAFDRERQEQKNHDHYHYVEDRRDINCPETQKEKVRPLKELGERFQE